MSETYLTTEQLAEIIATLDDPNFYIDRSAEAPALVAKTEALKAEIAGLYERWEELEKLRAAAGQ